MSILEKDKVFPLSENGFLVLTCLHHNTKIHGYGIKQQIQKISHGRIKLSTSSIYSILERFIRNDIVEISDIKNNGTKTIHYKITENGTRLFYEELDRLKNLTNLENEDAFHALTEGY